jgi:hypothetical protein
MLTIFCSLLRPMLIAAPSRVRYRAHACPPTEGVGRRQVPEVVRGIGGLLKERIQAADVPTGLQPLPGSPVGT